MSVIISDIRFYKNDLREKYRDTRSKMTSVAKENLDETIFQKLTSLSAYKECKTVITYVSTRIEVDTHKLIKHSLQQGKTVAVPKCIAGTRKMEFFVIKSMEDLEIATFSVLEPKISICKKLLNFENSICIVPGLAFDLFGYRLGYGKGYYDRFLAQYNGLNIGICYCCCTLNKLISGRFDKSVDLLVTEKYTRRIK